MDEKLLQFLRLGSELYREYGVNGIHVYCCCCGDPNDCHPDSEYDFYVDFEDVYKVEFSVGYELFESPEVISDR